MAMKRWIAMTFLLKLLLVVLFAVHPLQAQDVRKAIRIAVDLREAPKRVYHSKIEFPVTAGPLTLVYPKWIPGKLSSNGPIVDVTGLKFYAGGKEIPWLRDDVDMFAFHCNIPPSANTLEVTLDYLAPGTTSTAKLGILNWNLVLMYPLGPKSDDLTFVATLKIPQGWKYATALPIEHESSEQIEFKPASLTTLVDSTLISGEYLRTFDLSKGQQPEHRLNVVADSAAAAEASHEQLQQLRQLVAETGVLFGARHYRHYDFLLSLGDTLGVTGLEHHESSDNRLPTLGGIGYLLPHEFFHSWNGKYRRPAGLATPDYQQPMKGELLWVYEGLTQYYGTILTARSGLWKPEHLREVLAGVAAYLNNRPGRSWRNLQDTAVAAQLLYGARDAGASWRRGTDFYDEGMLIWLEADTIIRRETQGKRSLDGFCKKFYGGEDTGPKVVPYTFDDIVAAMQEIAPYDWRTFFTERLNTHGPGAPLGGIENGGWKLAFNETMNEQQALYEAAFHVIDVRFSLGMQVRNSGGEVWDLIPGSPAAQAGIAPDMKLVAVNGRKWSPEILREAIRRAKNGNEPIELLFENVEYLRSYRLDYHGGERYPHLERIEGKPDVLADIAKMKAPAVPESAD
jgi:predicted metalloprotease with PDZ domain